MIICGQDPKELIAVHGEVSRLLQHDFSLEVTKCKLLLQPGRGEEEFKNVLPGLEISDEGMVVVGAPIGTDAYVEEQTVKIVQQAVARMDALKKVGAQAALYLQSKCLASSVTYLLQVTEPRLSAPAARLWDKGMEDLLIDTLNRGTGTAPELGKDLLRRALNLAKLPMKNGGLGHTSASLLKDAAWLASELNCHDIDLDLTRPEDLPDSLRQALERIQGNVDQEHRVGIANYKKGQPKIQGSIMRLMHELAAFELQKETKELADELLSPDSYAARDLRSLQKTGKSWLVFASGPFRASTSISCDPFISNLRSYLLLPQMIFREDAVLITRDREPTSKGLDFSYQAPDCGITRCRQAGHYADRHLVHAHACKNGTKKIARIRHDFVKTTRESYIREAGFGSVSVEAMTGQGGQRTDINYEDKLSERAKIHNYFTDDVASPSLTNIP